ncbi:MAG: PilW family protein [Pseudomonadota bacterium]|uniref:PilW family protein n=1 Tax=Thermithiobacillus tepidarius TaxID=929 RepID=UPI000425583A|nr:PilW family protein [Thermithiobacillus tepidarius]
MSLSSRPSRTHGSLRHDQGFTMVELMVALVVSLLASVAIYSIFIQSESQQRRSNETADLWQQARIAMAMLERDVRMAGYGLGGNLGCQLVSYNANRTPPNIPAYTLMPIVSADPAPATPISGPGGSDQLTILYSTSANGGLPATQLNGDMPNSSAELIVASTAGFQEGDLVILNEPGKTCTLVQVTQVQQAALKLQHNPGVSAPYNPAGGFSIFPASGYVAANGVTLYNMGSMVNNRYSIAPNSTVAGQPDPTPTLMVTNVNTGTTTPVARGIVSLQVLYGMDTNGDNAVDAYARPTGGGWFAASGGQIRTVRIALLARASLPDRDYNSPASITLLPAMGGNAAVVYDVPNTDRNFRHQLFVTEVPLRNPILGNQTT